MDNTLKKFLTGATGAAINTVSPTAGGIYDLINAGKSLAPQQTPSPVAPTQQPTQAPAFDEGGFDRPDGTSYSPSQLIEKTNQLVNSGNTTAPVPPMETTSTAPTGASKGSFDIKAFNPDKYFETAGANQPSKLEDLYAARAALVSRQGDILTRAINTGIPFSPEQLSQLHQHASEILNPALADINAKIEYAQEMNKLNASKSASGGGSLNLGGLNTASTSPSSYTLKQGDYAIKVAENNGTDLDTLKSLNPQITDWNNIKVGTTLKLPTSGNKTGFTDDQLAGQIWGQISSNLTGPQMKQMKGVFEQGYKNAPDKKSFLLAQIKSQLSPKELEAVNSGEDSSAKFQIALDGINENKFKGGPVENAKQNFLQYFGKNTPEYAAVKALFSNASAKTRLALFGASLTNNEQKSAVDFLPNASDSTEIIKFKIQTLKKAADLASQKIIYERAGVPTESLVTDFIKDQKKELNKLSNNNSRISSPDDEYLSQFGL